MLFVKGENGKSRSVEVVKSYNKDALTISVGEGECGMNKYEIYKKTLKGVLTENDLDEISEETSKEVLFMISSKIALDIKIIDEINKIGEINAVLYNGIKAAMKIIETK